MSARILEVTEDAYHADPCVSPSLSHSIAHILLSQSPRHAFDAHPKLGGQQRESTKAMDEGAVLHRLLLGQGAAFEIVIADNWRTKLAQESREAILEAGKIPLLAKDFELLRIAADRICANAANQGFPLNLVGSCSELAIEFTESVGGDQVLCRCRLDQVRNDGLIYDVKKCRTAHPDAISRVIADNGLHLQMTAYTRAYEQLVPQAAGRVDFVFLFCEIEPPYMVVPVRLGGMTREWGAREWSRAVQLWRHYLKEAAWPWPGYSEGALTVEAPAYILNRAFEGEAA